MEVTLSPPPEGSGRKTGTMTFKKVERWSRNVVLRQGLCFARGRWLQAHINTEYP